MLDKIKKLFKFHIAAFFICFIGIFTVIDLLSPERSFSDLENRYLQKKPEFNLSSFYSGEYIPKYEKYINDQFAFRDKWINIKSRAEYYTGKMENNGIVYGKDGYMFDKVQTFNQNQLKKNVGSISKYADANKDVKINLMIIPSSFEILKDKLPAGLKLTDQKEVIENIYNSLTQSNIEKIDLISPLTRHRDEYIYYRTDHHWTTLGAYYAYKSFMDTTDQTPSANIDDMTPEKADYFLGTYYSKSKLFNAAYDYISYYDFDINEMTFGGKSYDSMYDYEKFKERDKYAAFLYGNNDVTVIKSNTGNEIPKRILVVKDSYGNSFIPFLTEDYDEIYVVDLRSNSMAMSEIMAQNEFDDVLIMYSLVNLSDDVNIVKITY